MTDMSKHTLAFLFAFAGGLLTLMIFGDGSVALICAGVGVLAGYFTYGLLDAKSSMLQEKFQKIGDLRGMSIEQIVDAVGPYTSQRPVHITDMNNAPGIIYTWVERNYVIELLFGSDNRCIGVDREVRV